jgi:hypothetical protein
MVDDDALQDAADVVVFTPGPVTVQEPSTPPAVHESVTVCPLLTLFGEAEILGVAGPQDTGHSLSAGVDALHEPSH